VPSFFVTSTTGEDHGLFDGSITPLLSILHTDSDKIVAVQNWSTPGNAKEIKSFLGLCSYYRKFVKGFADIAIPLHKACQKGTKFV
jgi:hypothetical protein